LKALVVGFGSIGIRHTRILDSLGIETAVVSRRKVEAAKVYPNISGAISDWCPDYVVVASRTKEHLGDYKALADAGFEGTVIIEKPLFDHVDEMPCHSFKQVYVAYNMRFHPIVLRFRELLENATPYAVHAYAGQYLPQWRPERDYWKSYSAIKSEGGGVLRDLSHELDFLNWILDGWIQLTAVGGHISNLKIDSDDVFSVLFETHRCPVVSVQMNYLDCTARREILAMTDKGSIRADLVNGIVEFNDHTESLSFGPDDTYIALHRAALAGEQNMLCSLDQGMDVLHMINAAESASAEKSWITA
jgi:predicted dehydrogenase